ncbi:methyltransferase domain-containing protein [Candidatus Kaiserbacteria bacterium]|nr:methyltransferase domain-containing protein [Candidatus Kaiserbacteria bacterium]
MRAAERPRAAYILYAMTTHAAEASHIRHAHKSFARPHHNVAQFGIEPGMTVVDFGAGSGAYVRAFAEALGEDGQVIAVDVQRDLLRRIHNDAVHRHHRHVRTIWGDLERPGGSKLADDVADLVLISNLLFQVEEKQTVLDEAFRILRPGGRVVVIDWSDSFGGLGPRTADIVTREAGLQMLGAAGFVSSQPFMAGAHHWGVMADAPDNDNP